MREVWIWTGSSAVEFEEVDKELRGMRAPTQVKGFEELSLLLKRKPGWSTDKRGGRISSFEQQFHDSLVMLREA